MAETGRNRRAGGRAERHAKRAAPPAFDPCPPGQRGGRYQPLTEPEIEAIYRTALRLLVELGLGVVAVGDDDGLEVVGDEDLPLRHSVRHGARTRKRLR